MADGLRILACVKRVPAPGARITLTAGRPGHRHEEPRLHDQPARGVRGRGGDPPRRAARRRPAPCSPSARPRPTSSCATPSRSGVDRAVLVDRSTARIPTRRPPPARWWPRISAEEESGGTVRPASCSATSRPTRAASRSASAWPGRSAARSSTGSRASRSTPTARQVTARRESGDGLEVYRLDAAGACSASRRASTCPATRRCPGGSARRRPRSRSSRPTRQPAGSAHARLRPAGRAGHRDDAPRHGRGGRPRRRRPAPGAGARMTGPVLVLIEHDRGVPAETAYQALALARAVADELGSAPVDGGGHRRRRGAPRRRRGARGARRSGSCATPSSRRLRARSLGRRARGSSRGRPAPARSSRSAPTAATRCSPTWPPSRTCRSPPT